MTVNLDATQLKAALDEMSRQAVQAPPTPPADVVDRFQAAMQKARMAPPIESTGQGMTVVSQLLASQDSQLQHVVSDLHNFSSAAPTLSLGELSASTMKLTMELASAQLDLQGKMGVVDSSKSAVETLMKNQ